MSKSKTVCKTKDKERTLVIIKPDIMGIDDKFQIIDEMFSRFFGIDLMTYEERKEIHLVKAKELQLSKQEAKSFYQEHKGKDFFERLTTFMCSGPIFSVVLEGKDIIPKVRKIIGHRDPNEADVNTIRFWYGDWEHPERNAIHASDSLKSAKREIKFFFSKTFDDEIFTEVLAFLLS